MTLKPNMLNATLLFLIISFSGLAVPPVSSTFRTQNGPAKIKGLIVDWQYARISHAVIIIKNDLFTKEVRTDDEGAFEIEVDAGTYDLLAKSPGFSPFRRKAYSVKSGDMKTLNILLNAAQPPKASYKCPRGKTCIWL